MATFILEIGTEELPARFLPGLEKELSERFAAALGEAGYAPSGISVCSTPRRGVVLVEGLESSQPRKEELVTGPPARVAFDAAGKPTKAAEGFARTNGVDLSQLMTVSTDKGDYVAVRRTTGGQATVRVLAAMCPAIIGALPFPKRMRWGSGDFAYARPIRWIVALYDNDVVAFEIGGVQSGRETWGHRVHGPGPFAVSHAKDFPAVMTQAGVVPSALARRAQIIEKGNAIGQGIGGKVLWNDRLLDEVQGLCEHPVPLLGDFDPLFLEVPREVLITSMESHQKSFGLEGADGKLLPHFLTVLNMEPPSVVLVKTGWERVLRARLEDARFFWKTDLASSFDAWLTSLETVTFLAPLGSMADKCRRVSALCAWLAGHLGVDKTQAARAGLLSKADLVSAMVGEFDTLQGIMGGIYARKMGEAPAVADALAEQYLPSGPDSPVPATELGCLLSMADKADTLVGCFGLGMIPTGAADPYALRRAALGIARIMLEKGYRLDVTALFAFAQEQYGERKWKLDKAEALTRLEEFFAARVKNLFLTFGAETLHVEAVAAVNPLQVWEVGQRLEALKAMSQREDFPLMVQTFKRVANIIRKQAADMALSGQWKDALLQEDAEKRLAGALVALEAPFEEALSSQRYDALFDALAGLRPHVDGFFDGVMVMCDDASLRENRLNLLAGLTRRMDRLADFSALQM